MEETNEKREVMVSEKLRTIKKSIADFLNERVNRLSASHKRISLLLFGFLLGIICIAQIVRSVKEDGKSVVFTIEQITLPRDILQSDARKEKLKELLRIKWILDSLKETTVYDSLMIARPGLVDSVNLLIQHYQSGF